MHKVFNWVCGILGVLGFGVSHTLAAIPGILGLAVSLFWAAASSAVGYLTKLFIDRVRFYLRAYRINKRKKQ